MANPTLTTKLEAVNLMLSAIGQAAVAALGDNPDATMAEQILDEVNKEVQSEGWKFNSHVKDLTADGSGYVNLDSNISRIDVPRRLLGSTGTSRRDLVMLGDPADSNQMKLYDLTDNTFDLGAGTILKDCEIVYLYDMILTPESFRNFITIRAARILHDRMVGATKQGRYTREDEARARARLQREEGEQGDYNILSSYVGKIVARPSPLDRI